MAYQYGQTAGPEVQSQPRCWSDERWFNPQTRDCRGCSSQSSCRDEIVRIKNRQAAASPNVAPPPVVYAYGHPAPQVTPPPAYSQQPVRQTQIQVQHQQQAQATPIYPVPQRYQYGWLTDPLYYQMAQSPRPLRPQLPGESFFTAAAKNMALSAAETFFMHCFLTVRQMAWAPPEPETMIDTSQFH
jgi:hypothetical protein